MKQYNFKMLSCTQKILFLVLLLLIQNFITIGSLKNITFKHNKIQQNHNDISLKYPIVHPTADVHINLRFNRTS